MEQCLVYMHTVFERPLARVLDKPLSCVLFGGSPGFVPVGFESDGSSVPEIFRGIFPRHRHPIAFFRHDYRCRIAKSKFERLWADKQFEKDVGTTSWWLTKKIGYIGVRIGAFFGAGVYYK